MARDLTLAQAASQVGLSADRFRKTWREHCARSGFPAPVRGGDGVRCVYAWDAAAVAAWREGRSGRVVRPPTPEEPPPALRPPVGANRARRQLEALRAVA